MELSHFGDCRVTPTRAFYRSHQVALDQLKRRLLQLAGDVGSPLGNGDTRFNKLLTDLK